MASRLTTTRPRIGTGVLAFAFALVISVGAVPSLRSQEFDYEKAARVKAAYLLNFIRYTQWPDSAFAGPDSPIVITHVGDENMARVLSEVVRRSGPIAGRPVVLRPVPGPGAASSQEEFLASLAGSHLIFVCGLPADASRLILEHLRGSGTLTVGDAPDFADSGGMFGFVLDDERILFEANPKAIQDSAINVSAKVLKLAQIVGEGGH